MVLALFAFVLLFSRFVFPIHKRFLPPFLPLALVGVFLVAYNDMFGFHGTALCEIGVICIALEYAWLALIWSELLGLVESPSYAYCLGFSIVIAAVLIAFNALVPFFIMVIFSSLLPIFSTIALAVSFRFLERTDQAFTTRLQRFKKPATQFSLSALLKNRGLFRLVMGAVASFAVYGFIYSFIGIYLMYHLTLDSAYGIIGFAAAGILLLFVLNISKRRLSLSRLYWVLQPVFITGLLLVTANSSWGIALISLGFMLLLVLCTLTFCEIGRRFETPVFYLAAFIFGTGLALCCIGLVMGYLCTLFLPVNNHSLTVITWMFIIGLTIYTAASSRSGGFTFDIDLNAGREGREAVAEETLDPHDIEMSKTVYYEAISQRCSAIGERYRLTPREREILTLLAQNQDTFTIAENLTLSKSTIKVHIHNIFEKLNVHRRADLMDFIHDR
ncbi:MAG: LuxR C-terminal-related transcriptional regulator [Coriobacteriales bacterium]|nr:LuxR C-terminal-related transcriptional regulator [Coriobacteriales bacterium]